MYYVDCYSAILDYFDGSKLVGSGITAPKMTEEDVLNLLDEYKEYIKPGFTRLNLWHGVDFFEKPGQRYAFGNIGLSSYKILFAYQRYSFESLKQEIEKNKKYKGYEIKHIYDRPSKEEISYVYSIYDKREGFSHNRVELGGTRYGIVVNPTTFEQVYPVLPEEYKGKIAPIFGTFFQSPCKMEPIGSENLAEFVNNYEPFAGWAERQERQK